MEKLVIRLRERLRFAPAIESHKGCQFSNEAGETLPPFPPNDAISLAAVHEVERKLGFPLPSTVRRLSVELADGGYGPSWGIYRLQQPAGRPYGYPDEGPMSVESWHALDHSAADYASPGRMRESLARYPERFIRYCEVGCNITICVDCTTDAGKVFVADPSGPGQLDVLTPLADSVEQWLWDWLDEPWPATEYVSLEIRPETFRGPILGCLDPADEPNKG